MRIVVDRDRCAGLGVCESLAPAFFEVDDEGDLVVLVAEVDGDGSPELERVTDAVLGCPTSALQLQV